MTTFLTRRFSWRLSFDACFFLLYYKIAKMQFKGLTLGRTSKVTQFYKTYAIFFSTVL